MSSHGTSDLRSPTFIHTDMSSSSKNDSKEKRQTCRFLPVRTCDMDLAALGIPSASKPGSAPKPFKFKPVRTCDMDPSLFEQESVKPKKSVCKQLWSGDKKNSRYSTSFKPARNIRKSIAAKPIPNSVRKVFQEAEEDKKERKLRQPSIRLNKSPTTFQIPTITIQKPDTETNTKSATTYNELADLNNKYDELLRRLEAKIDSKFNEICIKVESEYEKISSRLSKLELGCKKCSCQNMVTKEEQISVKKERDIENDALNNSCDVIEQLELKQNTARTNEKIDQKTTEDIETNEEETIQSDKTLKISDSSLIIARKNKKILIDCNKIPINKFEILESKLKYGSPISDELSLTDTDSPACVRKDINWLINDKTDSKSPLFKSLSTSSINSQPKKTVTFQSQTDLQSDTVNNYNEMRNNAQFLCTPKNTRIVSNLMTPSIENSQKRIISRRVQKQLLMLE